MEPPGERVVATNRGQTRILGCYRGRAPGQDTRTGSLSSTNGARRRPLCSPSPMTRRTSPGNSTLSPKRKITDPPVPTFLTGRWRWRRGSAGSTGSSRGWNWRSAKRQMPSHSGAFIHRSSRNVAPRTKEGPNAEAVEKSFKLVRDRLRALTTYEIGPQPLPAAYPDLDRRPDLRVRLVPRCHR